MDLIALLNTTEIHSLIGLAIIFGTLAFGAVLGYYARQSIAKKQVGTLEERIQKRISQAKEEAEKIIVEAKEKASKILEAVKKEEDKRRRQIFRNEKLLLRRESLLDEKLAIFEREKREFQNKVEKLRGIKKEIEAMREETIQRLERVSGLTPEQAKKELLESLENEYRADVLERIRKLEKEGKEKIENKAKHILSLAMQRCAISLAQEMTTATVVLPNDEIKGRIIGKEGRNIRALEKATGCEIVVDDTPEAVVISGFDPIRRHIAKLSLEKLVQDGRIQPARIEETVESVKREIASQIQQVGEAVVYDLGILDLHPKIVQLLGRLKFRTSYGQNVLLHSIEVAYLAEAIASELGLNSQVAKKAGLLHDIGKAIDHQVEGSHVDIGIKILERFGVEKEVIAAMKSHHEEYPYETLEAVVVQVADQISGARPGARKDTLENYLKRLERLEEIATSFPGVEKAYAIQAGREVRVFVKPEEIDDLTSHKLARQIADRIQSELKYPGEIKVNVIRETRVVEYAK